jgi:hypothetical protein
MRGAADGPGARRTARRTKPSIGPHRLAATACVLLSIACAPMQVGEECMRDHCVAGAQCAMVTAGVDQCVALCESPFGLCEGGEVCYPLGYADHEDWFGCYPGGTTPIGAVCTYPTECERGAWCRWLAVDTPGFCGRACNEEPCSRTGEPCSEDAECISGLCVCPSGGCAAHVSICMEPCDHAPSLCADGDVCIGLSGGGAACFPPGTTAIGATCSDAAECERGAVCFDGGSGPRCVRACNGDTDCVSPATCSGGVCG